MTPRLDEYGKPTCQMANCDLDTVTEREHPEHGAVKVCDHCADLFDAVDGQGGSGE